MIFSQILFSADSFLRPTYPANFLLDGFVTIINPFFWIIHIGNVSGSIIFRKKIGMKTGKIVLIDIINLFASFFVYLLLHKMLSFSVSESLSGTGMDVLYGVFNKEYFKGIK